MKQQFETEQKPMFAAANDKWLAVDLDGTLAVYNGWKGEDHIGDLILPMAEKIMKRVNDGWKVAIFTARVSGPEAEAAHAERVIWQWVEKHKMSAYISGITAIKHKHFCEFWDDRARQVIFNKGHIVESPIQHDDAVKFTPSAGEKQIKKDVLQEELNHVNLEVGCSLDVQVGGSHYKDMVIQPAEYCEYNNIPALEASVIKYVSRHMNKNGVQDLEKAKDLINMIIEMRYEPTGLNHLAARINSKRHNKFEGK